MSYCCSIFGAQGNGYLQLAIPDLPQHECQGHLSDNKKVISYFIANPPKYDPDVIEFKGDGSYSEKTEIFRKVSKISQKNLEKDLEFICNKPSFKESFTKKGNVSLAQVSQQAEEDKRNPMQLKLKPKYAGSLATLQFRNPTDSFSTRCDVVYKTLLRDCRRYFYDCFQMKTMRKNKRVYHLSKTLAVFVDKKFDSPNFTEEFRRQIEFCLGCLVYPKEMTNSKVAIYGEEGQVIKGQERAKKLRKVKELHSYLYNFSMDKCEKFFKNPYLSAIFEEYLKSFTERATQIETIRKNYEIYQAAVGLIRNLLEYYKSNNC
ncbi:unnamed protein product [Moneuplotes crassus]|uniref:Uncharacterized protein n=2 Tax=Euplotes crassus TaxID=5936 RepID=A0AAD1Y1W9_EUPCR|nr:unnamed protein product [Moneuplotes crassus]